MTILEARLNEIESDFSFLDGWEEKYSHIIDIGKSLEPLSESQMTDEFKVKGCTSQVWLIPELKNDRLYFKGGSDSTLVKGLLGVMLSIYSDALPKDILGLNPEDVFKRLALEEALTPNRANGLKSMANKIIEYANNLAG